MSDTDATQLEALAREHLGPSSARASAEPECAATFARLRERDVEPVDAAFAALYPRVGADAGVAGEFLAYFTGILLRRERSAGVGGASEPEDLVQSVVADLFPQLEEIDFRSRREFLSLLLMRLRWKGSHRRHDSRLGYDEAALASALLDQVPGVEQGPSTPLSTLVREEEEALVVMALQRLEPGDQALIRASLEGVSRSRMAEEAGCSAPTLRKRLERARQSLRIEIRRLTSPDTRADDGE